jgi:hypothetical protein
MSKTGLVAVSAVLLVTACPVLSLAEDISAKKLSIKDNANPAKRTVLVSSKDVGVQLSEADDPGANGAALHLYSATDDFCLVLPAGAGWKSTSSVWKYSSKATKTSAQIGDGKLSVKAKSGVTYTLADNGTQGTVNAQVQFGTGTRYCMHCTVPKKDTAKKYLAKGCVAAACDPEPSTCSPSPTTSTSTTATTSTSATTTTTPGGSVIAGALPPTAGHFNFNATLGLPGANAACSSNFPTTHACTYAELQNAQTAGELVGLKDVNNGTVTSFWAIDNAQPALQQCNDDQVGGSGLNWEYGTADTPSRGQRVALNNPAGTLGSLQSSVQCNIAGTSWVGCCF